jgi:probable F420-dependent oxidoreductase
MAHPRKFRFGIQCNNALPAMTWTETVQRAETLGYSTVFLPDHFGDQLAPLPAMMAAASATTALNVGALVFDNDYKHPVVLAKELATIDLLSEGRVEFGLGSGWMRSDYEQSGIPYEEPKVRVERFFEAVEIIRGLWGPDPVDFSGEHYQISDLNGFPKPHRPGGPKLLIGGGAPRMLRFAGKHADIVGINPSIHSGSIDADAARDAGLDRFEQKLQWVREGAGDRFEDLELNVLVFLAACSEDTSALAEMAGAMFATTPELARRTPTCVIGTEDQICEELNDRRDKWGLSYYVFQSDAMETMAPIVARLSGS